MTTLPQFTPFVGESFFLNIDGADPVELVLLEAVSLGDPIKLPGDVMSREPFSLLFRGAQAPELPQATYPLEHPRLGVVNLFLVPVGPDETGPRYESVFN